AEDRAAAIARLDAALAASAVPGIVTNIDFLRTLLALPEVVAGDLDTSLIDNLGEDQLAHTATEIHAQLAAAAVLATGGAAGTTPAERTANRSAASAWAGPSAWRASRPEFRPTLRLATGGQTMEVVADADRVDSDADGLWRVVLGGVQHTARIFSDAGERTIWVSTDRGIHVFTRPLADSSLTPGL